MSTYRQTKQAWSKIAKAHRARLERVNDGKLAAGTFAGGTWTLNPYRADVVDVIILDEKHGYENGRIASVIAPDGDARGLRNAAGVSELPALLRLLDTIEHELTVTDLNPEELLQSVQTLKVRIARKAEALAALGREDGELPNQTTAPAARALAPIDVRD
jgi:hypothetical protein